jgi:glycosyltransferase involved in cell wall biosynthesis
MKLQVLTVTYNHGPYIAQAIESVLMQQTAFNVEMLIGEDCSTDDTRAVIESYREKYPDRIKPVFNEKNLGPAENFKALYHRADAEYIALLEGDDYWTDASKLARQVEFLERNPTFSFSFHNVNIIDQSAGTVKPHFAPRSMAPYGTLANLLRGNYIQSCSVVYRRSNLPKIPEWLQQLPLGDWPLHILHAEKGPFGYIDEIMAVYRILGSGSWANRPVSYRLERSIESALRLDAALAFKYTEQLGEAAVRWYNHLIDLAEKSGDHRLAFGRTLESLDAVKNGALHAPYLPKYLTLFVETIAGMLQRGETAEALALYRDGAGKIPFVNELRKLDEVMSRYAAISKTPPAA